jgi:hypothetical protein
MTMMTTGDENIVVTVMMIKIVYMMILSTFSIENLLFQFPYCDCLVSAFYPVLIGSGTKKYDSSSEHPGVDSSSISSEAESVDDVYTITDEQREYYIKQFLTMQPNLNKHITGHLLLLLHLLIGWVGVGKLFRAVGVGGSGTIILQHKNVV